jgi:hypothetical protein
MPKTAIDRQRLQDLLAQESACFSAERPISGQLFEQAKAHLLDGVPTKI